MQINIVSYIIIFFFDFSSVSLKFMNSSIEKKLDSREDLRYLWAKSTQNYNWVNASRLKVK